jgi:hypothetical protein
MTYKIEMLRNVKQVATITVNAKTEQEAIKLALSSMRDDGSPWETIEVVDSDYNLLNCISQDLHTDDQPS